MKLKVLTILAWLMASMLPSCTKDCDLNPNDENNQVSFSATIESKSANKVSGTTWKEGDAIGVFMKATGNDLSDGVLANVNNLKHTTTGDGQYTAESDAAVLPSGTEVDFIAYYPYQSVINNFIFPVNVADQSDLSKIDLLYSDNAKAISRGSSVVALDFKHQLSLLVLDISAGEGVPTLNGLEVSIKGLVTEGSFDLSDASLALGTQTATITRQFNEGSSTLNAILVPSQDIGNATLTFTLGDDVYEWAPAPQPLASGKKYTYSIKLESITLEASATIADWTEGNTGESEVSLSPKISNAAFEADKTTVAINELIQFTDQTPNATGWSWNFGDGSAP
ncbi:MAG: fimbrillin family protein, partial [Draconibacterium sp.]